MQDKIAHSKGAISTMADILHQLRINAPATQIYHALTDLKGLAHWWTRYVSGTNLVNSILQFTFQHGSIVVKMKVIKLIPNRTVIWHCISGFPEWEGTQLSFDLETTPEGTILHFAHRGWRRTTGNFPKSNFDWARHLASLRNYLEKGAVTRARR